MISFVLLLAGIGGMVWYFAAQERPSTPAEVPSRDPLLGLQPTPSQRATAKYFYLTAALIVVQVGLGVITAHYGVEGSGFYGLPLDRWLPSAVTRTWHTHVVLALGPTFSALEVVPLVLIGFEAWENVRLARARGWRSAYRWPMAFFVGGARWNVVGAGLCGVLINPPMALDYIKTTPVHAHPALFGVYGRLGIGLMWFCRCGRLPGPAWKDGP